MFDIAGQHALITGSASGIGYALCERLLGAGTRVSGLDLNNSPNTHANLTQINCDVSDNKAVTVAFQQAVNVNGKVDLLVNCAGVGGTYAPLHESETRDVERTFSINTFGVLHGLKQAQTQMNNCGSIVNIASLAGLMGVEGLAAYAASKAAAISLTRTAAVELASREIRVNAICPGSIVTPMEPAGSSEHDMTRRLSLLQRSGTPDDITGVVHFLACKEAAYINGQVIVVDGGLNGFISKQALE